MKGAARNASLERGHRGLGEPRGWAENAPAILRALGVENLNAEDAKGRRGKDRTCSPPRHQEHQGKENIKLFIFILFAALVRKRDRAPGVEFRCPAVTAHLFFLKPSAVLCVLCVSNFNAEDAKGRGGAQSKEGGTDPHSYEKFRSPQRHQGRDQAKTSWRFCVLVVG